MFRNYGLIAGSLLLVLATPTFAQQVTDEVDRFTGDRKIHYSSTTPQELGVPHVSLFSSGGKTAINGIRFMYSPPLERYGVQRARFIGCDKIDWLIDGRPASFGVVVQDMKRYSRTLIEMVSQSVSADDFTTIGRASTVEYRICGVEGKLSAEDIRAAAIMAQKLSAESMP